MFLFFVFLSFSFLQKICYLPNVTWYFNLKLIDYLLERVVVEEPIIIIIFFAIVLIILFFYQIKMFSLIIQQRYTCWQFNIFSNFKHIAHNQFLILTCKVLFWAPIALLIVYFKIHQSKSFKFHSNYYYYYFVIAVVLLLLL